MGISLTYARDVYTKKRPKPKAKQRQKTQYVQIYLATYILIFLISVKKNCIIDENVSHLKQDIWEASQKSRRFLAMSVLFFCLAKRLRKQLYSLRTNWRFPNLMRVYAGIQNIDFNLIKYFVATRNKRIYWKNKIFPTKMYH